MSEGAERLGRDVVAACLGYRTRKLARAVSRLYNDGLRPLGLNIAEMNLLAAVAAHGPVRAAALGRAMDLEKSTLSRNTGRLIERGWVELVDDPDGGGGLLAVTAAGERTLAGAIPAWTRAQERARSLVASALPDLGGEAPG